MILWHHGKVKMDAFHRCEQQVALVIFEQTDGPWLLSDIYASIEYREWRVLWSEISRLLA